MTTVPYTQKLIVVMSLIWPLLYKISKPTTSFTYFYPYKGLIYSHRRITKKKQKKQNLIGALVAGQKNGNVSTAT